MTKIERYSEIVFVVLENLCLAWLAFLRGLRKRKEV